MSICYYLSKLRESLASMTKNLAAYWTLTNIYGGDHLRKQLTAKIS